MEAKEKAKELVEKLLLSTERRCTCDLPFCECPEGMNKVMAVKCAIIAVDEILNVLHYIELDYEENTVFWNEVKKELETL